MAKNTKKRAIKKAPKQEKAPTLKNLICPNCDVQVTDVAWRGFSSPDGRSTIQLVGCEKCLTVLGGQVTFIEVNGKPVD